MKQLLVLLLFIIPVLAVDISINKTITDDLNHIFVRNTSEEIVTDKSSLLIWQDNASSNTTQRTWVNANKYCKDLVVGNITNWNLPTASELESLVEFSNKSNMTNDIFQNTRDEDYWSSTKYAASSKLAWSVNFKKGYSYGGQKSSKLFVRCVQRSKKIKKKNYLIFQDSKENISLKKDYKDAQKYCKSLNYKSHNDWFLPSMPELLTLTDRNRMKPAIKKDFKYTNSSYYWTSSTNNSKIWTINFKNSDSYLKRQNKKYNIRCARSTYYDNLDFDKIYNKLLKIELSSIDKPQGNIQLVRGEFEPTADFNKRVAKTKSKKSKTQLSENKKYQKEVQKAELEAIKKSLETVWGRPILTDLKYDADNSYFVANIRFEAKKDFKKKIAIKVALDKAKDFKSKFPTLEAQAIFSYENNSVKLKDIRILDDTKVYVAQFTDININDTRISVNINTGTNNSNLVSNITVVTNQTNTFNTKNLSNFNELKNDLKKSKQVKEDKHKWLFAVGIEKYDYTDNISYAKRSAEMFVKIAYKNLGVPKQNSFVMIDSQASQAKIKTSMKKLLRRVKDGDTIYFYYNGHGVPVPSLKNTPFMLASDTEPDFVADEKFFALDNIYTSLSNSKASKVIAFVDSCFSGVTDGKAVLKGVAATKMVAKSVKFNKEKMVVISAGKGNQYSNGYDKKAYRLFSFYIMKNIIKGDDSIKALYKNTKTQTYDTSMEEYGDLRAQEPTIDGNFRLTLK